ncbi:hypothetical protein PENTCL1PPCAC_650, partial [Pristionchus entomophagus]
SSLFQKLSEAPIMAKSTPDIIVVPPTSHNSVSCNVSGFIPLTPQQQAAIDRKHQELTTATTSPSGRNSSRPSGSSPSRVDEQGSIDCESPPLGPMLMFSYLNSCTGKEKSAPQHASVTASFELKNMPVRNIRYMCSIKMKLLSHTSSNTLHSMATEDTGISSVVSISPQKRASNELDNSSSPKRLRISENSPQSPLL